MAARILATASDLLLRQIKINGKSVPITVIDVRRSYHTEVVLPNVAKSTAEGPVWLNDTQQLLFTDALCGDIHLWDSSTGHLDTVHYDGFTTFCIPHRKGGYVASINQEIIHFHWSQHLYYKTLAKLDDGKPTRLNDAKCDEFGRLFAGTMGLESRPAVPVMEQGSLYSIDTNNKTNVWDTKFHIANSMAFSPDHSTMYLTESIPGLVYAYDYDLETGSLTNRRVVIYLPHKEHGILDRMTIDTDGHLWAAYYGGGKVTRIDPVSGQVVREVFVDCPTLTCLTFGGEKYDELYVTSSSYGENLEENKLAGSVFKITGLGVKGLPPNFFNGK